MAARRAMPRQGTTFTANAVTLLLAAWFTTPVIAAPNIETRCDDVADATLEIPARELKAEIVNHDVVDASSEPEADSDVLAPAQYLAPQAEATLREVFEEISRPLAGAATPAASDDAATAEDVDTEERSMNTRVPGVSDAELARYRQQMYRIDI